MPIDTPVPERMRPDPEEMDPSVGRERPPPESKEVPQRLVERVNPKIDPPKMVMQPLSPHKHLNFMVGEWQTDENNNRWHMQVEWNDKEKLFKGLLTKHGARSLGVGFAIGEHCWTAKPIDDPDFYEESQKFRADSNTFFWKTGKVDLRRSTADVLATSQQTFTRVKVQVVPVKPKDLPIVEK
jgi:hypothetical protein